jgi:hypothetical protein
VKFNNQEKTMEQITLKLDDSTLEKMRARMAIKECKTLSQCARELIDLALKIEETAACNKGDSDEIDMMELLKNNLIWSLETRFLIRFLLQHSQQIDTEKTSEFMTIAKTRATEAVDEILNYKKSAH